MRAFISYSTVIKIIAGDLSRGLKHIGVDSFLAHEDIEVSREWQTEILRELETCDLFFAILNEDYFKSPFCVQESGIAVFRRGMTVVPLSVDGTVPKGFMSHIQSNRIDPQDISQKILFAGIAGHDAAFAVDQLIGLVGSSGSYRSAEANFDILMPHIGKATDDQITRLLKLSEDNSQVCHAGLCASKYLPPLFASHGHLMDQTARDSLKATLARYKTT